MANDSAHGIQIKDGGPAEKAMAIAEVCFVTLLTVGVYKALKTIEPLDFNCSPGIAMIIVATSMIFLHRNFAASGLVTNKLGFAVKVGTIVSLALLLGGLVQVSLLKTGASTPLTISPSVTLGAAALWIPFFLIALLVITRKAPRDLLERIAVLPTLLFLAAIWLAAPALAIYRGAPAWQVAGVVASLTVCTGFGEELFFRGYVQSRLNGVFGRPWKLAGVPIGPGLLIASLLFGAIHVLNPTRPFEGHWEFSWLWGATALATGLFYGFLRELTDSIWAGTIVHSLTGVYRGLGQVFLFR